MSLNTISSNATVDYATFRSGVNAKDITAPFYADISKLDGVDWNYTTMTETALASTSTTMTVNSGGFEVDSDGFFTTDFNKAAGIPDNIKIHQAMLVQAEVYSQAQGENTDPVAVISRVWNLFKTIAGNTLDPDKDGYITQNEINAMPKSYVSKGSLMDGIVSIQNTMDEMYATSNAAYKVSTATDGALDSGFRGFAAMGCFSRTDTDPNIGLFAHRETFDAYSGVEYDKNLPSDKIAVGELFDSFFYQKVDGETAGYISAKSGANAIGTNVNATKEYYKFLDSGQDMQTYLCDTKGKDYLDELKKRMSTLKNGQVDPELAKLFFSELGKEQQNLYEQYKANNYAELDPSSSDTSKMQIPAQSILDSKQNLTSNKGTSSALSHALQKLLVLLSLSSYFDFFADIFI